MPKNSCQDISIQKRDLLESRLCSHRPKNYSQQVNLIIVFFFFKYPHNLKRNSNHIIITNSGGGRETDRSPSPSKKIFFSTPFFVNIYNFSSKITEILIILKYFF